MPDTTPRRKVRYDYAPLMRVEQTDLGELTHAMVSVCVCHGYAYTAVSWSARACENRIRAKFRKDHQPEEQ